MHYSSGMSQRLAFALTIAIEFDCFLIDEALVVGDARFHQRCLDELFKRRSDRAFIIVSHNAVQIREFCQNAVVLHEGQLMKFPTLDEAYEFYNTSTAPVPRMGNR
jgi:capsular polysaccharide transport system ATP-binding protein